LTKTLQRGELAARLGGDEFAVVVENASPGACSELARQIIHQISEPYLLSTGGTVSIGISIGIALAADGDSFERLVKRADTALYSAKAAGRGAFRFFGGMVDSGVIPDATSS
jgi:diguanylate cyclase (GGDEF)-like protein